MSDGAEIQRCFDWHQGEQLQRARQADEHAVQGGAAGAAARLVYHLIAHGRIVVEDEARYSVLEASVRDLAAALECSTSTAWESARYWMELGVMARRAVGGRSQWLLSWPAFWAFGRVRSCSAAFGGVRRRSAAFGRVRSDDNREGKPRSSGGPVGKPRSSFVFLSLSLSSSTTTEKIQESIGTLLKILWEKSPRPVRLDIEARKFLLKVAIVRTLIEPIGWIDAATLAVRTKENVEYLKNPAGFWRRCLVHRLYEDGLVDDLPAAELLLIDLLRRAVPLLADHAGLVDAELRRIAASQAQRLAARRLADTPGPPPTGEELVAVRAMVAECRGLVTAAKPAKAAEEG